MEVPSVIYHATLMDNLPSIIDTGIEKRSPEGIYFSDTKENAMVFIALRVMHTNSVIVTIAVDTSLLDINKFVEGTDHSVRFFKDIPVYVYPESIPSEALILNDIYSFDMKGEHTNGTTMD